MAIAWMFDKKNAGPAHTPTRSQTAVDRFQLRPMPNEDIHVFVKKIDNTRVVREQDPKANASAWKTISMACLSSMIVVGMIVPIANSYLAGYTVTEIEKQNNTLQSQLARLTVRESELTSVEALAKAAKNQKYLDPTPETMVVLNEPRTGDVALNRNRP
ncbi:MAG TPA: hypothetical protein VFQ91_17040 [Bryobacteraceae bacterium]|nr:hypothetical protein [Bryobacteraceae bacterium]